MNAKSQAKPKTAAGPQSPLQAFMVGMAGYMMVALARQLRSEEMSIVEFGAIHLLLRGKPLRINELADGLAQPLPATSRIVSTLVERGLVERHEDPDDRRAKVLTLTPAGRTLIEGLAQSLVAEVGVALSNIEGDVRDTMRPVFEMLVARETGAASGSARPKSKT